MMTIGGEGGGSLGREKVKPSERKTPEAGTREKESQALIKNFLGHEGSFSVSHVTLLPRT